MYYRYPSLLFSKPGFDPDAQAFFTAAGITDATQKSAVNQLVLDLKGYSLWTGFQAIYPIVGGTAGTHSYNLKNPATYQLTFNGTWTHNSGGADPDSGSAAYADTGLAPNVMGQDSLSYWYYSTEDIEDATVIIGAASSSLTWIYPRYPGNTAYARTNDNTGYASIAAATSLGLFGGSRIDLANEYVYRNGSGASALSVSGTPSSYSFYLAAYNSTGSVSSETSRNCAFAAIGDGLDGTQAANLYTAVQTYETALSRQV